MDKLNILDVGNTRYEVADDKARNNIASEYDSSSTYSAGDFCLYDGVLYKANQDIDPAEAWDATHWDSAKIMPSVEEAISDNVDGHLLADVTSADEGKVMSVDSNGDWALNTLVPASTSADEGKLLTVDSTGAPVWADLNGNNTQY